MNITIEYAGVQYFDMEAGELLKRGVPQSAIGVQYKANAAKLVSAFAEQYRSRLASTSAGKLAEYRIKEEISRDPTSARDVELDLLSREAKARGTNRTGLIGQINAQAAAFRHIALLIGVLEAEANAAISVISDDASDIETQVGVVLISAEEVAETEYQSALILMAGG